MMRRSLTLAGAALVAAVAVAGPSVAAWSTAGTATAGAAAATLQPPASASAAPTAGATTTSITVSWTPPAGGPAPTKYRVDRVSPAGTVCTTVDATISSCVDSGRTPGTSYAYNVYALISNWDGTPKDASTSTGANADTAAPTVTPTCPTNGSGPWGLGNPGSWSATTANGGCNSLVSGTAADTTGVAKVEIAIQRTDQTTCWNGGGNFNTAAASCPEFHSTALGTPNGTSTTWSIGLGRNTLTAGKTYTVTVRSTDTRTPANVATMTYNFTT